MLIVPLAFMFTALVLVGVAVLANDFSLRAPAILLSAMALSTAVALFRQALVSAEDVQPAPMMASWWSDLTGRDPSSHAPETDLKEEDLRVKAHVLDDEVRNLKPAEDIIEGVYSEQSDLSARGLLNLDSTLALVRLRIDIESALRELAKRANVQPRMSVVGSIYPMARALSELGVLESSLVGPLRDISQICNTVLHGGTVPADVAASVVDSGLRVLAEIRAAVDKPKFPQPPVPAELGHLLKVIRATDEAGPPLAFEVRAETMLEIRRITAYETGFTVDFYVRINTNARLMNLICVSNDDKGNAYGQKSMSIQRLFQGEHSTSRVVCSFVPPIHDDATQVNFLVAVIEVMVNRRVETMPGGQRLSVHIA